jgi:hydrogenase maturation protease
MSQGAVFIVGYGNCLRGDDGVGQEVAQALWRQRGQIAALVGASINWAHQLTPEMAPELAASRLGIFVDAACDSRPAGSVTVEMLGPPPGAGAGAGAAAIAPAGPAVSTGCWQDLGPRELLALAFELYGSAPPAALVSVGVGSLEFGVGLSPTVRAAVPRAVATVRLLLAPERSQEGSIGPVVAAKP